MKKQHIFALFLTLCSSIPYILTMHAPQKLSEKISKENSLKGKPELLYWLMQDYKTQQQSPKEAPIHSCASFPALKRSMLKNLTFSPSGKYMYVHHGRKCYVYDTETASVKAKIAKVDFTEKKCLSVAFKPDDSEFVTVFEEDLPKICPLKVEGRYNKALPVPAGIKEGKMNDGPCQAIKVLYNHNGDRLATICNIKCIEFWDTEGFGIRLPKPLIQENYSREEAPSTHMIDAAFSSDDQQLAVLHNDTTISVWKTKGVFHIQPLYRFKSSNIPTNPLEKKFYYDSNNTLCIRTSTPNQYLAKDTVCTTEHTYNCQTGECTRKETTVQPWQLVVYGHSHPTYQKVAILASLLNQATVGAHASNVVYSPVDEEDETPLIAQPISLARIKGMVPGLGEQHIQAMSPQGDRVISFDNDGTCIMTRLIDQVYERHLLETISREQAVLLYEAFMAAHCSEPLDLTNNPRMLHAFCKLEPRLQSTLCSRTEIHIPVWAANELFDRECRNEQTGELMHSHKSIILTPHDIQVAHEKKKAAQTHEQCPICLCTQQEIARDSRSITPCCKKFICSNDLAIAQALDNAKCPYCRNENLFLNKQNK